MFYICKKREDGLFGVMDTRDGVVEYYTPQEILKYVVKLHVDIEGVYKKDNGSYGISVLKPTKFEKLSSEDLGSSTPISRSNESGNDRDLDYFVTKLNAIAKELTGNTPKIHITSDIVYCDDMQLGDGYVLRAMGFNLDILKTTNPDSQYFYFCISDKDGDPLINSPLCISFDNWEDEFENNPKHSGYPYESLFSYRLNYYARKYENFREDTIRELASGTARDLRGAVLRLTGVVVTDDLELFDGIECMGYNIPLGSGYTMNIYFNPEIVNSKCIMSSKFGLDFYKDDNWIKGSHLDLSFEDLDSDNFDSIIDNYNYNYLFRVF